MLACLFRLTGNPSPASLAAGPQHIHAGRCMSASSACALPQNKHPTGVCDHVGEQSAWEVVELRFNLFSKDFNQPCWAAPNVNHAFLASSRRRYEWSTAGCFPSKRHHMALKSLLWCPLQLHSAQQVLVHRVQLELRRLDSDPCGVLSAPSTTKWLLGIHSSGDCQAAPASATPGADLPDGGV